MYTNTNNVSSKPFTFTEKTKGQLSNKHARITVRTSSKNSRWFRPDRTKIKSHQNTVRQDENIAQK